jgi:hypothetical protein
MGIESPCSAMRLSDSSETPSFFRARVFRTAASPYLHRCLDRMSPKAHAKGSLELIHAKVIRGRVRVA